MAGPMEGMNFIDRCWNRGGLKLRKENVFSNGASSSADWAGEAADLQALLRSGMLDPAADLLLASCHGPSAAWGPSRHRCLSQITREALSYSCTFPAIFCQQRSTTTPSSRTCAALGVRERGRVQGREIPSAH